MSCLLPCCRCRLESHRAQCCRLLCRRLCGDNHQDELAQTLHAGIDDYFALNAQHISRS